MQSKIYYRVAGRYITKKWGKVYIIELSDGDSWWKIPSITASILRGLKLQHIKNTSYRELIKKLGL